MMGLLSDKKYCQYRLVLVTEIYAGAAHCIMCDDLFHSLIFLTNSKATKTLVECEGDIKFMRDGVFLAT